MIGTFYTHLAVNTSLTRTRHVSPHLFMNNKNCFSFFFEFQKNFLCGDKFFFLWIENSKLYFLVLTTINYYIYHHWTNIFNKFLTRFKLIWNQCGVICPKNKVIKDNFDLESPQMNCQFFLKNFHQNQEKLFSPFTPSSIFVMYLLEE